jgi:hypothetical protein
MGLVVETQQLAKIYQELKRSSAKRINSLQLLHTMSKHLNVAQIYVNNKACIIENPGKEMLDLLKCLENIKDFDEITIKNKMENIIGNDFNMICEYLDTKRDKDTLKAILTKLTSSTFMAMLANVQDKRSFHHAKRNEK